jgi:hypothetical protein
MSRWNLKFNISSTSSVWIGSVLCDVKIIKGWFWLTKMCRSLQSVFWFWETKQCEKIESIFSVTIVTFLLICKKFGFCLLNEATITQMSHAKENNRIYTVFSVRTYQISQYVVPCDSIFLGKWRSSFARSSDGKMNVQSACALNTR